MNAGLGGGRVDNASRPSSLSCNSRFEVSARDQRRSEETVLRMVFVEWDEEREERDVEDEAERREVVDFVRGAATGIIIPVFFRPDRENFGALVLGRSSVGEMGLEFNGEVERMSAQRGDGA